MPFLKLNGGQSYFSIASYPVDLQTIRDRLKNLFYRRVEAIRFDVKMLAKKIKELEGLPVNIYSISSEENVFVNGQKITKILLKIIE